MGANSGQSTSEILISESRRPTVGNLPLLLFHMAAAMFLMAPLTRQAVRADTVRLLSHGNTALAGMHAETQSAQKSIDLTNYTFDPCSTSGKLMMKNLIAKSRSGVKVRLLLDANVHSRSSQQRSLAFYLSTFGVQVKVFNAWGPLKYTPAADNRMHGKVLIIDGKRYISGGRNIGDEYFGLDKKANFVDRDVAVDGSSARQARSAFDRFWKDESTGKMPPPTYQELDGFQKQCLKMTKRDREIHKYISENSDSLYHSLPADQCDDTRFIADDPGVTRTNPFNSEQRYQQKPTTRALVNAINGAKSSVTMENWSYLPEGKVDEALEAKRNKGKGMAVTVYTNKAPDVEAVAVLTKDEQRKHNTGSQKVVGFYAKGHLEDNWRFTPTQPQPEWRFHAKTTVTDAKDVIVGSMNLDRRSYATNVETAVVVKNCPELAGRFSEEYRKHEKAFKADLACEKCKRDHDDSEALPPIKLLYKATERIGIRSVL